jgi:hypothetical protein
VGSIGYRTSGGKVQLVVQDAWGRYIQVAEGAVSEGAFQFVYPVGIRQAKLEGKTPEGFDARPAPAETKKE